MVQDVVSTEGVACADEIDELAYRMGVEGGPVFAYNPYVFHLAAVGTHFCVNKRYHGRLYLAVCLCIKEKG